MSLENVKSFYNKLETDKVLLAQIEGAQSKEDYMQIAKNAGYDFTNEEMEEYTAQLLESNNNDSELTDEELANVAGGFSLNNQGYVALYGLPSMWYKHRNK
ncbi:MAG: Nif11-like leader peptide family natural product precursor [Cyanobacteria bacterium P01_A01_bin.84]